MLTTLLLHEDSIRGHRGIERSGEINWLLLLFKGTSSLDYESSSDHVGEKECSIINVIFCNTFVHNTSSVALTWRVEDLTAPDRGHSGMDVSLVHRDFHSLYIFGQHPVFSNV